MRSTRALCQLLFFQRPETSVFENLGSDRKSAFMIRTLGGTLNTTVSGTILCFLFFFGVTISTVVFRALGKGRKVRSHDSNLCCGRLNATVSGLDVVVLRSRSQLFRGFGATDGQWS